MDRQRPRVRPVDVQATDHPGNVLREGLHNTVGWEVLDHFIREHPVLDRALHVNDRRLRGDGDRFFQGAHAHLGIHCGGELRRQIESVPLDRVEPGQRKRHRIRTRPQVDDSVQPLVVGHDVAHLLDECGAGRLDGHAGHHCAGRILDHARDAALRDSHRRDERQQCQRQ